MCDINSNGVTLVFMEGDVLEACHCFASLFRYLSLFENKNRFSEVVRGIEYIIITFISLRSI